MKEKEKKFQAEKRNLRRELRRKALPDSEGKSLEEHLTAALSAAMSSHPKGRRTESFGRALAHVVMTF